jgi:peptide/nickel transport system permease protein
MLKYTIRRLLMLIPVLLGVSLLTFAIIKVTPGDPARLMLGFSATQKQVDELRQQLGLNDPFLIQYGNFIWKALHGNLGVSFRSGQPIVKEILDRFPRTLELTAAAMGFAILIGIPCGILAATTRRKWLSSLIMVVSLSGLSIPNFYLGIILLLIFGVSLKWISVTGGTGLINLILPAFSLGFAVSGSLTRLVRSSVLEIMNDDYVRTARAKGLRDQVVNLRHVLPNALIPVVTVLGLQFAHLLGGAVFIENVFVRYGLGRYGVQAISTRDFPAVQGMVLFMAVIFTGINLLIDLSYGLIDPRIRYD